VGNRATIVGIHSRPLDSVNTVFRRRAQRAAPIFTAAQRPRRAAGGKNIYYKLYNKIKNIIKEKENEQIYSISISMSINM